MKKILLLLICLLVFVAGCTSSNQKKLNGTWENTDVDETWATFEDDIMIGGVDNKKTKMEDIKSRKNGIYFEIYYNDTPISFGIKYNESDKNKASVLAINRENGDYNQFNIEKTTNKNGFLSSVKKTFQVVGFVFVFFILFVIGYILNRRVKK